MFIPTNMANQFCILLIYNKVFIVFLQTRLRRIICYFSDMVKCFVLFSEYNNILFVVLQISPTILLYYSQGITKLLLLFSRHGQTNIHLRPKAANAKIQAPADLSSGNRLDK